MANDEDCRGFWLQRFGMRREYKFTRACHILGKLGVSNFCLGKRRVAWLFFHSLHRGGSSDSVTDQGQTSVSVYPTLRSRAVVRRWHGSRLQRFHWPASWFTRVVELLAIINHPAYSILMNDSLLFGLSLIQQCWLAMNKTVHYWVSLLLC